MEIFASNLADNDKGLLPHCDEFCHSKLEVKFGALFFPSAVFHIPNTLLKFVNIKPIFLLCSVI